MAGGSSQSPALQPTDDDDDIYKEIKRGLRVKALL